MKRICEDCGALAELHKYNLRCRDCDQQYNEWSRDYSEAVSELLGSIDARDSELFEGELEFFDFSTKIS